MGIAPTVRRSSAAVAFGLLCALAWAVLCGLGTPARSASNVPTRMLTFLQHVCYDSYCYYGHTIASPREVASLVDFAQPNYDSTLTTALLRRLGVKVDVYFDPNLQYGAKDSLTSLGLPEDAFLHDCAGKRVMTTGAPGPAYLMDLRAPSLVAAVKTWTRRHARDRFDAIWFDDMHAAVDYFEKFSSLPCKLDRAAWDVATRTVAAASRMPFIFNSLSTTAVTHVDAYNQSIYGYPSAIGGDFELCYGSRNHPKETGAYWRTTENSELASARTKKLWICLNDTRGNAADNVDARTYLTASLLLTYDPWTTVVGTGHLRSPDGLQVYPETTLIALSPLRSAPADIDELRVGGAYLREYGDCYVSGSPVGSCAILVNPDSTKSVANPLHQDYARTLRLKGADVYDGGTIDTNGRPAPPLLPPASGLVVFR